MSKPASGVPNGSVSRRGYSWLRASNVSRRLVLLGLFLSIAFAVAYEKSVGASGRSLPAGTSPAVSSAAPSVRPRVGGPHSVFRIRLVVAAELGTRKGVETRYELSVFEGNRGPQLGCEGSFADDLTHGHVGQPRTFRERPDRIASGWCIARYRGAIRLVRTSVSSGSNGASRILSTRTIARVSWQVRPS